MKNLKKKVSLLLAAVFCFAAALPFAGCGNENFPVKVANITIEKEPMNIVVLDSSSADIISYMNYDGKIVGRSDEVDQRFLSVAPSVGAANTPDVQKIIDSKAEIVFAGDKIDENCVEELENAKIKVIKISLAGTPKELERNYITIGKLLGGMTVGTEKGKVAYDNLIEHMDKLKVDASTAEDTQGVLTVCYLYVDNGTLCAMNSSTYVDMLLGYTGAVNVAVNMPDSNVDVNMLKVANPNFLFYADEQTRDAILNDKVLSQLDAVTGQNIMMVTQNQVIRQGLTALETLEQMIYFMHPSLAVGKATPDQATAQATSKDIVESVAEKYEVKLENLSLKKEDENDNVKAMQQRLYDLGYITDSENVTGYYGEVSAAAVEAFQKNSQLEQTGVADNQTLRVLFVDNAPKAK